MIEFIKKGVRMKKSLYDLFQSSESFLVAGKALEDERLVTTAEKMVDIFKNLSDKEEKFILEIEANEFQVENGVSIDIPLCSGVDGNKYEYYSPDRYRKDYPFYTKLLNEYFPAVSDYLKALNSKEDGSKRYESVNLLLPVEDYIAGAVKKDEYGNYDMNVVTKIDLLKENLEDFVFIDKDNHVDISELPNYQELIETFVSEVNNYYSHLTNIYNFDSHYSSIEDGKISIDWKLHKMNKVTEEDIADILEKRGFNRGDISEFANESNIINAVNSIIEHKIEDYKSGDIVDMPKGVSFTGIEGRMGGYGVFEIDMPLHFTEEEIDELDTWTLEDFEYRDIDPIKDKPDTSIIDKFSDWIMSEHESILNLSADEVANKIIEINGLGLVLQKDREQEKEIVTTISEPLNKFRMNGTAWVLLYGDNPPQNGSLGNTSIQMDEVIFTSDNLSSKEIFTNLNDGGFGVEAINGATDVVVEQEVNIEAIYKDGTTSNSKTFEVIATGDILSPDDDSIVSNAIENGYKPHKISENSKIETIVKKEKAEDNNKSHCLKMK